MNLLILTLLISVTAEPIDSLEAKGDAETTSEEVEQAFQYTFGMDTYRAGFNKGSISTNTLEEQINTTNGNLELKIKLLSLPIRGNKTYDLYLTYRGSPLSIPGMQIRDVQPYKTYGYDAPPYNVEDSLFKSANDNKYIVTSDMGNCGLGWNVMPGELSLNPKWQEHYISNDSCYNKRRDGFIHLNGGEKYSIYNIDQKNTYDWCISGKRNWNLNINVYQTLSTPVYTYEFGDYPVEYPNPRNVISDHRELYPLTKITDRDGNYVNIDWWSDDSPPEARIPQRICTPTDTCYIYGDDIAVDTADYCLWDFWVIDSIIRNVNGEKFKVNFHYHQDWFPLILEYWYGHAFVLLDSVEFLKNGSRSKSPYRFEYEDTLDAWWYPDSKQGELVELMTPDGAKYEYTYDKKSYSKCKYGSRDCGCPYESSYRVVNKKVVTLPDTAHIESGDGSNPDGVYEYEYFFGESVGPSSGHWWNRGGEYGWYWYPLTYYPIYDKCTINMPDTGSITYFNVDSTYVDNLLDVIVRGWPIQSSCSHVASVIRPFEREEFYGKPYKIMTYNNSDDRLKLEQFYWTITDKVLPCDVFLEYPLHPFLRCKAVQMDPDDDTIKMGEEAKVYYYPEYDKYDNKKTVHFLGEATLTGDSSYDVVGNGGRWRVYGMPEWSDADPLDNWEVRNSYLYEVNSDYADAFLYNLVDSTFKSDYNENLVQKAKFEYDNPSHLVNIDPNPPCHDPEYGTSHTIRGNLTKKTEWMNNTENRSQQYWYDICGNLVKMKDYLNYDYELYYGPAYVFPDSVISPDGFKTDFNFDRKGRLTSIMDKSGIVDSFEYDIYGRLTEYRKGVPSDLILVGKYQYNDFTRGAREISYNSTSSYDVIDYSYDGLGRLIKEERALSNSVVKDYIYNGNGQVIKQTQPRFDNISLYDADYTIKTFDGLGRVTEIEYPSDGEDEYVEYFYDGDITTVFDEEGDSTKLINDASGNLDTVIDALGNETYYCYDVNGNLLTIEDAEGKFTDFYYNWLGNLVRREGPDRGIDTFAYDANGNTKYHKNNSGDEIEFEYDELNRIEIKRVNNQVKETYYYDSYDNVGGDTYDPPDDIEYPKGRLTGFENANVKEVYYYDKFGNLAQKLIFLSTGYTDTIEYFYDLKGRLTKLQYPGGGYKVEYEYDKLGNISSVEINDGEIVTLSSTAAGLLSGVHFPGGVKDSLMYNPRNWMESMHIEGVPDPYYTNYKEFYYNKRGELTEEKRGDPLELYASYQYDALGRLKTEDREGEDNDHWFTYDKVGNRTIVNGEPYDYEMGTNKLRYIGQDIEYEYNEIGCISSKTNVDDTTYFYYDPEGRLTELVMPGGDTTYNYYYKGHQRIREEKLVYGGTTTEDLVYLCEVLSVDFTGGILEAVFLDGNKNVLGTQLLENILDTDSNWVTLSGNIPEENFPSGTFTIELRVRRTSGSSGDLWVGDMNVDLEEVQSGTVAEASNYFYDNAGNLIMVDDENSGEPPTVYFYAGNRLLAKEEDGDLHFYHLDRIGSPVMITDESGNVVKEKKYEAFGNLIWEEGTLDDNREFTGKEKDPTGFHYFGARYYSGDIGRFLSPDPAILYSQLLDLAHPLTLHPYAYCHNDPLNFIDPWGLFEEPENWMLGEGVTVIGRRPFDAYTWWNEYQFFNSSMSSPPMIDNTRVVYGRREGVSASKFLLADMMGEGANWSKNSLINFNKGYGNLNVALVSHYLVGGTFGVLKSQAGWHVEIGLITGNPGASVGLTRSTSMVTSGFHSAAQVNAQNITLQAGTYLRDGSTWGEGGFGAGIGPAGPSYSAWGGVIYVSPALHMSDMGGGNEWRSSGGGF